MDSKLSLLRKNYELVKAVWNMSRSTSFWIENCNLLDGNLDRVIYSSYLDETTLRDELNLMTESLSKEQVKKILTASIYQDDIACKKVALEIAFTNHGKDFASMLFGIASHLIRTNDHDLIEDANQAIKSIIQYLPAVTAMSYIEESLKREGKPGRWQYDIVRNKNLSPEDINRLIAIDIEYKHSSMGHSLCRLLSEDQVIDLSVHADYPAWQIAEIAKDVKLTESLRYYFSNHDNANVRCALAKNKTIDIDTLKKLSSDSKISVAREAVKRLSMLNNV